MRMHKVDIDDEVYVFLQAHARPFEDSVNDVLRRLLLAATPYPMEPPRSRSPTINQRRPGDLMPLLKLGLLEAGDELVFEQPRKGAIHRATVTEDGWLTVNDEDYPKVSPALKSSVGNEINGWKQWIHRASGRPLEDLRAELRRTQDQ